MALNWTIEVFLSLLSVILTLYASIIIFRQNLKNPDRALLIMGFAYLSLSLYFFISGIGYLMLDPSISMLKNIFLVLICLTITMTTNQMINGRLMSYQLVIVSFFSSFAIASFLFPISESITYMEFDNGDQSLQNIGFNRVIIALLFFYVIVNLLYFSVKIFKHAPRGLRQDASLYFGGNFFLVIGALTFITGFSTTIPGIVEICVSLGIVISSIGLIRAPQILYVLPFSAIKLSIIKSDSGISFYNYYWRGDLDDTADQLFGAAFLAITNFMQETVGKGGLEEIKLEGVTMTIKKPVDQPIYYVVIATKQSYVLRQGLEQFARSFNAIYGDLLSDKSNYEVQQFKEADKLIEQCFPYIPEYN